MILWLCEKRRRQADTPPLEYSPSCWQLPAQPFPRSGVLFLHLTTINSCLKNNFSMTLAIPHTLHMPYLFLYMPFNLHPCALLPVSRSFTVHAVCRIIFYHWFWKWLLLVLFYNSHFSHWKKQFKSKSSDHLQQALNLSDTAVFAVSHCKFTEYCCEMKIG